MIRKHANKENSDPSSERLGIGAAFLEGLPLEAFKESARPVADMGPSKKDPADAKTAALDSSEDGFSLFI